MIGQREIEWQRTAAAGRTGKGSEGKGAVVVSYYYSSEFDSRIVAVPLVRDVSNKS